MYARCAALLLMSPAEARDVGVPTSCTFKRDGVLIIILLSFRLGSGLLLIALPCTWLVHVYLYLRLLAQWCL